jgi:thymidylate synthase (FAD)
MEIIERPQIYLLGRPTFDVATFLNFLDKEGFAWRRTQGATQAEEIVEVAGRICYMSFGANQSPRDNLRYIQNLISMGHESVFEHVAWTVLITGISRSFSHQLVRHRVGFAFSQLSQQYHDERDANFVLPLALEKFPEVKKIWNQAIRTSSKAYAAVQESLEKSESILKSDLSRKEFQRAVHSAARSVLPQATETKIIVTLNARAARNFLRTRGSIPGDIEMRQVATALLEVLKPEAPSLFFDFEIQTLSDESPAVVQLCMEDPPRRAAG